MKKYRVTIDVEIDDDATDIEWLTNKLENTTTFRPAYSIFGDFIGLKIKP